MSLYYLNTFYYNIQYSVNEYVEQGDVHLSKRFHWILAKYHHFKNYTYNINLEYIPFKIEVNIHLGASTYIMINFIPKYYVHEPTKYAHNIRLIHFAVIAHTVANIACLLVRRKCYFANCLCGKNTGTTGPLCVYQ